MKRRRWAVLLCMILVMAFAWNVAAEADVTAPSSSGQDEVIVLERSTKIRSGLAMYSTRQNFMTMSMGSFPGSYGAQLSGFSRTVYDSMVSYFVTGKNTGELPVSANISFKGTGSVQNFESWDSYQRAQSELEYAVISAFGALLYDHPEFYWAESVSLGWNIEIMPSTLVGSISRIYLAMDEIYSGAKNQQSQFESAVAQAVNAVNSGTAYDKLKKIHDYLCGKITYPSNYNLQSPVSAYHSAAGVFLTGGTAVCEGYAKAFMILCKRVGINAILVVGDAGGAHMWNYVQLDGKWYVVDVTWDDSPGRAPDYDYFLIGSRTLVSGREFGSTRTLNMYFSDTTNSKKFSYPILNGTAYPRKDTGHTHTWTLLSETKPTCTQDGQSTYRCTICNETSFDLEAKLGHSFTNGKYVYNNDATALKDGTKSILCDNGCGTKAGTVTAPGTKLKATIKLNVSSLLLRQGQSTKVLKVSKLAKGDAVKSWKSSNTKVFKVDKKTGKITARKWSGKKTKTAKLTVTLKSGLKKTIKVTVQAGTVTTKKITGISKKLTLKKGKTKKLAPVLSPITSQQKVTYSSSNKKVVTVSSSGKLTAKKKGTAIITVKSGTKTVKCKVKVK